MAADLLFCSAFSCSTFASVTRRSASSFRISSTGAVSPFFRAPSRTRSGCSLMKLRLSMVSPQVREEDDVTDRGLVGDDRGQAVDAQAHTPGWREAVLERGQEVFIHGMGLLVPGGPGAGPVG